MDNIISLFNKASDGIDRLVVYLVFILMAGMVFVTTAQIIFRVFLTALTWSEELSRYLLVWGTFFAATLAYKRGNHIAITYVIDSSPKKLQPVLISLTYIFSLVFFACAAFYGWEMIRLQVFQVSPAIGLPMQYVYFSMPASLIIMSIHALNGLLKEIRRIVYKEGWA